MEDKFTHCSREIDVKALAAHSCITVSFSNLLGFAVTLWARPLIRDVSIGGGGLLLSLLNSPEAGFRQALGSVAWVVKYIYIYIYLFIWMSFICIAKSLRKSFIVGMFGNLIGLAIDLHRAIIYFLT